MCDPLSLSQGQKDIPAVEPTVRGEKTSEPSSTILYIEDNPLNLTVVENFLRDRSDIKLISAPQAKLGLELAYVRCPDLILLDINLPGMNGIEALQYLQSYEETKTIPVIAISADAMEVDIERAKRAGFKEYLTKPIDIDLFCETLDLYLQK